MVQWTTGNVGRRSVAALSANPSSSWSAATRGRPTRSGATSASCAASMRSGVTATDDVDALLALRPDCVVYNPMWLDVDELVRILDAGVNVVSTAAFINGRGLGADRDRLVDACERGGSSLFGTGVSPGFVELLAIVIAGICDRVDKVTVNEAADTTFYDSPTTEIPAGFGRPIDDPELPEMTAEGTAVFGEAVALVADALASSSTRSCARRSTPRPPRTSSWSHGPSLRAAWPVSPPAGREGSAVAPSSRSTCGGRRARPSNPIGRSRRASSWRSSAGRRCAHVEFLPPPDFEATTFADFMVLGMIMTAMPAINAIPLVVAAPPGIVTYNDLPLPLPAGLGPRRQRLSARQVRQGTSLSGWARRRS